MDPPPGVLTDFTTAAWFPSHRPFGAARQAIHTDLGGSFCWDIGTLP